MHTATYLANRFQGLHPPRLHMVSQETTRFLPCILSEVCMRTYRRSFYVAPMHQSQLQTCRSLRAQSKHVGPTPVNRVPAGLELMFVSHILFRAALNLHASAFHKWGNRYSRVMSYGRRLVGW
jgi:hypothetical protein